MKKVIFSEYALFKIELLKRHNFAVDKHFTEETMIYPDKIDQGYKGRYIAQK